MNLTNEVLKDIISSHQAKRMSIDYIQDTVAEYFQIDVSDLKAKKRTKNITVPRHVAMYLCRELTEASLPKIGESFGGRDHTTVLHACDRVREMMKNDAQFSRVVKDLVVKLNNLRKTAYKMCLTKNPQFLSL